MAQISLTVLRCPDYGSAEQRLVRGVELTIGRGSECDWALPDPLRSLSRRHCRLEQVGAGWQVVDLSANGTFINFASDPIGRDQVQPLRDGDRLRLGDYELEVQLSAAAQAASLFAAPAPEAEPTLGFAAPARAGDPFGQAPVEPGLFGQMPAAASPFGASRGPASPAPLGGFGAVRLPGLDDPVGPDTVGDGLDLDISGAMGGFGVATPSPSSAGFAAQDDHAPATGDAFQPPAVSLGNPSSTAAKPESEGQGLVPDDWFQSIALATPGPAAAAPDFTFSPAPEREPLPEPQAEPFPAAPPAAALGRSAPAAPSPPADSPGFSPFAAPGAVLLPFDEPPAPEAGPPLHAADFRDSTAPGAYAPAWREPLDVSLTGPAAAPVSRSLLPPTPQAAAKPVAPQEAPRHAGLPAQSAQPDAQAMLAALSTLLAGAGLPPETLYRASGDPEAALRHAGAVMQVAVAGLRALLVARGLVKREFRIEQTMLRPKENNPLKFAPSDEHALAALLDPRTAGLQAVQEAVSDLSTHEVAVLAATQAAARALLERLSPALLEAEDPGGSGLFGASAEKRLWGAYKRHHEKLMLQLEDDFDSAFGTAFARAYEQAVGGRKR